MDPLMFCHQYHRLLKYTLRVLARFCILISFLVNACRSCCDWQLERILMSFSWQCGVTVAGIYIGLTTMAQFVAAFMVLAKIKRPIASAMLGLLLHLRVLTDPMLWNLHIYIDILAIMSALLMNTFKMCRHSFMAFLFLTFMTWRPAGVMWTLFKYFAKIVIVATVLGNHRKEANILLLLCIALQSLLLHAWWNEPYGLQTIQRRQLKHFFFWNRMSMIGGLVSHLIHDHRL